MSRLGILVDLGWKWIDGSVPAERYANYGETVVVASATSKLSAQSLSESEHTFSV